ncbi:peptidoglycan-associated lipoprotein Pal [Aliiroseovarius sp. KMU-50]|uniref:Peptidoglycan-associated lipoprotein n=1 Tax=Aliiroseovarius salicola TaxID=3009082 RepID=A0ABT4W206_9RHOB|nr:peptidoglycan-associated lipoprotein Pal [Aliiroseovarius sp. KMU-50]MDA5094000.1 peptidoglycan-associated lipoprotein Pal [Aliiroseovarius sp. KMU-50]
MKPFALTAVLVGVLAVAGCSKSPGALDAGFGAGAGGIVPGSASDPSSPAYFQQTIGDRVLFAVDQSTVSPEGVDVLNKQAVWLMENPAFTAVVEGHADEQGTREYNLALGARRASAVQNFLIERGVAPNRLKTVSYGKERPLEICSDEICYAKNRRAVTVLAAGGLTS